VLRSEARCVLEEVTSTDRKLFFFVYYILCSIRWVTMYNFGDHGIREGLLLYLVEKLLCTSLSPNLSLTGHRKSEVGWRRDRNISSVSVS